VVFPPRFVCYIGGSRYDAKTKHCFFPPKPFWNSGICFVEFHTALLCRPWKQYYWWVNGGGRPLT